MDFEAAVRSAGRKALRDCGARDEVGEVGGEARNGAIPFQAELLPSRGFTGLAFAGGVVPAASVASSSSEASFVLVIWAEAIDVVVRGGAVEFKAGVKLDVRIRGGGPCRRDPRKDGGRDDGAVLYPDIGCCASASATTSRCCSIVAESYVGTELGFRCEFE